MLKQTGLVITPSNFIIDANASSNTELLALWVIITNSAVLSSWFDFWITLSMDIL